MPRKGRKTIDLPDTVVDMWKSIYIDNKNELNLMGITSFQGMMAKILHTLLLTGAMPTDLVKFLHYQPE